LLTNLYGIPAAFLFAGIAISCGAPLFLWLTRGLPTSEEEIVGAPLAERAPAAGG
jgi:hypothetical protein